MHEDDCSTRVWMGLKTMNTPSYRFLHTATHKGVAVVCVMMVSHVNACVCVS